MGVKAVMAELSYLKVAEIHEDRELADMGIDSAVFNVTDLPGLMRRVMGALGMDMDDGCDERTDDTDSNIPSAKSSGGAGTVYLNMPAPGSEMDKDDHTISARSALDHPFSTVMATFNETKELTDIRVAEYLPLQNELKV
ncbi:uncharacterized protein BCR38DRAFT_489886 [Pseudomassariella vexata]|uniref:Uncharacterized protein n=1 Tax=Pseudomassariella vexata TaxID=1141098 RepID=A0A1Y2DF37_9PEZI|nr:uncharacterized protein BCR38DRAFT_489886 [Pseudomassariella vexata]ORY57890.1 hypothetical protein BCR38DRAFT_489886 [Pseudomassariella vexata]